MNSQRDKKWVLIFIITFCAGIAGVVFTVIYIDPFFHYHAPLTDQFFYQISSQRSQNDGITRNFNYTGLITGTSVTKNFKTSEAEELFSGTFIKIPYDGATYLEINESVARALERNPELKRVIRGVDLAYILSEKDYMWADEGTIPEYLYDGDVLNDVSYVLNRDVFFSWVCGMLDEKIKNKVSPGIVSFDEYGSWSHVTGANEILPEGMEALVPGKAIHLLPEQKKDVLASVHQNLTDVADEYPDVEFIYFIPPTSMVWWYDKIEDGSVYAIVEAERIMLEEVLQHPNIRLFSWNDRMEIGGNLDNYSDSVHYGEWINDLILRNIRENVGLITEENYGELLERELNTYLTFDYLSMMD